MRLNEISDIPGANKKRMRVGRGIGSGKGKQAGRGGKGQTARSGVSINGFEGGQMPLHRRLPKRGFRSWTKKNYALINLGDLQAAIDSGRLDAKKNIDTEALVQSGVISRKKDGVRLLGTGELKTKVTLAIAGGSKSAIEAVEKLGGKLEASVAPRKDKTADRAKGKAGKSAKKAPKAEQPQA